ncbi:MAG: cell division protein FtsQ/DivIB, partial [Terriglobales bacterium]
MRVLPDQIRVAVVERQPVAFARQGQQFGLVDADGVLLNMPVAMMTERHYSFPVLTGFDDHDSPAAGKARMDAYLRMKQELTANGAHDLDRVSEIDLTDPENARVLMQEQGSDILADFGRDHFLERFQRYEANVKDWRQQYPNLGEVDLRYDHQAVLEMKHKSASASLPDAGSAGKPAAGSRPDGLAKAKYPRRAVLARTSIKRSSSKRSTINRSSSRKSTDQARSSKAHHAQVSHVRRRAKARRKTSSKASSKPAGKTSRRTRHENQARASHARTEQGQ